MRRATRTVGRIHIGFFKDFQSSDTLLIDGDAEGLRSLANALRQLATSGGIGVVDLRALPFVELHHGLQVLASCVSTDAGASFQDSGVVAWARSAAGWKEAADKIDALCVHSSGHQYLDDASDITVQASTGEYGAAWWQTHG